MGKEERSGSGHESRSLALTPTWSVGSVLLVFVCLSLVVERSIHRFTQWLHNSKRKPLFEAVEKMKQELMLLGFISLMLTATSSSISNICIESKNYDTKFSPCRAVELEKEKLLGVTSHRSARYLLLSASDGAMSMNNACKLGYEPFVSFEGLEQLHRFIFVMAITHVFYSCLTMLLAIVKMGTNYKAALIPPRIRETIHGWEKAARRKRRLTAVIDDQSVMSCQKSTTQSNVESHQTICEASCTIESSIQTSNNSRNDLIEIEMPMNIAIFTAVSSGSNMEDCFSISECNFKSPRP